MMCVQNESPDVSSHPSNELNRSLPLFERKRVTKNDQGKILPSDQFLYLA
ncbi:hypothetical protein AciX9_4361 (plasmid) [Granulicella tundricola MP5ACTX9]|uniref:Uncharacterized protein n=1 Tax=Granulicella tundricola (strain ATCC BAA-1859 / DSM 23138 / MP5ACTX9) TaxID=1198114 RepID=E8X779_GRATM|nr:hypothetical protein AciX9_4361 [Granulicella tundricola MP5ACTX9]